MHEQPKKQPCSIGLLAHVSASRGEPHSIETSPVAVTGDVFLWVESLADVIFFLRRAEAVFCPDVKSHRHQAKHRIPGIEQPGHGRNGLPEDPRVIDHIRLSQQNCHQHYRQAGELRDHIGTIPVVEAVNRESRSAPETAAPTAHGF